LAMNRGVRDRRQLILWIPYGMTVIYVLTEALRSRSLPRAAAGLGLLVLSAIVCVLILRMDAKLRAGGYPILARTADNLVVLGLMGCSLACFGTLVEPAGLPPFALIPLLVVSGTFLCTGLLLQAIWRGRQRHS
jgi:tetrahydromethanopterin S-methyltransferase subunit C